MGSKDDLFGSDERTVLHRRAGGGRSGESAAPPAVDRVSGSAEGREETVFEARVAASAGWSGGTVVSQTGAAEPRADRKPDAAMPRDLVFGAFAGLGYASPNPILRAAGPLLILLAELRLFAAGKDTASLSRNLAGAIRDVDRNLAEAGVGAEEARIAKYVLCEMADDIVASLPGIDAQAWLVDGMVARTFGAVSAGTGFFEALNKVLADPEKHRNLLELMHACLSLGFEGQYRRRPAGREGLERVRLDAYETLRYFRDRPGDDISPSWQGLSATMVPPRRRIPAWAIAAAMPAVVAAAFFGLRALVTDRAELAASALLALTPTQPVQIQHAEFAPVIEARPAEPPPPPVVEMAREAQIDRIRRALAREAADGDLELASKGDFIVVRLDNLTLFGSGSAEIKADFQPIAGAIAAALSPEPGPIRIVGHTDSQRPGRTSIFKSNHDLSVARAKAVEAVVKPMLDDPSRVEVDGEGDEDPIADNSTPDGRARNRRVEIMIRKEETL